MRVFYVVANALGARVPGTRPKRLHLMHSMELSTFDDLLCAAQGQPDSQRLLFVFAKAGIPDDATREQRQRFQAGRGGTLTPLMCVDKTPDELVSFDVLLAESREFGQAWDIVFVAALPGTGRLAPTSEQAQEPLQRMVEAVKSGAIGRFVAFDAYGEPVQFD